MRRTPFLIAAILSVVLTSAASSTPPPPQLPAEVRYVCVVDEAGTLISMVTPFPFKPDPADLGTFKANLTSAINLAGRSMNRPDIIQASATIQLIDNPVPPLGVPGAPGTRPRKPMPTMPVLSNGAGCVSYCQCAKPILCSTALPGLETDLIRKNPRPSPPGGVCGCGPGCAGCELCTVICS